jgi:5-methylcytosine-specific restriction endonuclease McrA
VKKHRPKKLSDKDFRERVWKKTNGCCAYCGEDLHIKKFQIDHIICEYNWESYITNKVHIPGFLEHLTIEDLHHFDNLFASCRSCNSYKDTHPLEGFRVQIGKQIERLRNNWNFKFAKRYGLVAETPKPIVFYFETLENI